MSVPKGRKMRLHRIQELPLYRHDLDIYSFNHAAVTTSDPTVNLHNVSVNMVYLLSHNGNTDPRSQKAIERQLERYSFHSGDASCLV